MAEKKIKSVIWSTTAIKQFTRILEYLEERSEFGFNKVSFEVIEKTSALSKTYNLHPVDGLKSKNDGSHRICFVFHYRISFKVVEKLVKITSIRHTSRIPLEH